MVLACLGLRRFVLGVAVFSDGRSAGGVRTLAELEGQQPPMSSAKPAVNQEAFNKLLDMIGGQSNSSPAPPQVSDLHAKSLPLPVHFS